jgi:hypothetical protein
LLALSCIDSGVGIWAIISMRMLFGHEWHELHEKRKFVPFVKFVAVNAFKQETSEENDA